MYYDNNVYIFLNIIIVTFETECLIYCVLLSKFAHCIRMLCVRRVNCSDVIIHR